MNAYHNLIVRFAQTRVGGWMFLHVFHPIDKRLMRWTSGTLNSCLGTNFYDNAVLLSCTGAKSGKPREVPLLATPFDGQFVLIAGAAGHEKNPAWYYNLKANPECSLFFRRRGKIACVAHEAKGEERERAWAAANKQFSGYTTYQGRTERRIPAMVLTPCSPE